MGYSSWGHKELDTTERITLSLHFQISLIFFCVGRYFLGCSVSNCEGCSHFLGSGLASEVFLTLIFACLPGSSLPLPFLLT